MGDFIPRNAGGRRLSENIMRPTTLRRPKEDNIDNWQKFYRNIGMEEEYEKMKDADPFFKSSRELQQWSRYRNQMTRMEVRALIGMPVDKEILDLARYYRTHGDLREKWKHEHNYVYEIAEETIWQMKDLGQAAERMAQDKIAFYNDRKSSKAVRGWYREVVQKKSTPALSNWYREKTFFMSQKDYLSLFPTMQDAERYFQCERKLSTRKVLEGINEWGGRDLETFRDRDEFMNYVNTVWTEDPLGYNPVVDRIIDQVFESNDEFLDFRERYTTMREHGYRNIVDLMQNRYMLGRSRHDSWFSPGLIQRHMLDYYSRNGEE